MKNISALKDLLSSPKNIVITTHANPDADALGSSLGLFRYLVGTGHQAIVITPTDYANFLTWMPANGEVLVFGERTKNKCYDHINEADLIFCLDFSGLNRIKDLEDPVRQSSAKKVLIDHHLDPEDFADFQLWDTGAAATAELIYDFLEMLDGTDRIDAEIANCLYAGIMTDTGSFKHPSTTAKVHETVAKLIAYGADINYVNRQIYDTNSVDRLRFIGFALLEKLVVRPRLKVAYFYINNEDRERFNLKTGDTEGLVNYALS
ncbi:MAG: bifunctional oligoribonuclease/PAP phosphatase NrnA, partial [Saprospiraceae bacterium]|nr:bifunctional oligoribonuclease/PAP phosphatase NrnA [Saprospiraceae bacterium]